MSNEQRERPSLKDFDAYSDRNGQGLGQGDARDIATPARTQHDLKSDPSGQAEAARIASGTPRQDATEATEAETPPENLRHIGDASQTSTVSEALDRATAPVGKDSEDGA
ncbi:hypothetical protein [Methylobacterium sp. CM6247]